MSSEIPPRRRGRPKLAEPSGISLTTWLRPSQYDQLARLAAKHDVSLSSLARDLLLKRLPSGEADR